jgi:energy-coupling factor transporter ATP-binding protein EcfA2
MLLDKPLTKSSPDLRPFHPLLSEGGEGLSALVAAVKTSNDPSLQAEALDEIGQRANEQITSRVPLGNPSHRGLLQLRACALVLRDLAKMGWMLRGEPTLIWLSPPQAHEAGDRLAAKAVVRVAEVAARDDHLSQPSVRNFIQSLENPGRGSKALSVTHLIGDGSVLHQKLSRIAALPRSERPAALRDAVQPYLQVVTPEVRCQHTGIRLTDVWRYFRLTWSTPYKSQPGRNVFYLIRDAAQPHHPVMGIAALGNSMMQQAVRDDRLGWSVDGFERLLKKGVISSNEVLAVARRSLETSYQDIYKGDLPLADNLSQVDPGIVEELQEIALQAKNDRKSELEAGLKPRRFTTDDEDLEQDADAGGLELLALAESALFKAKRAKVAAELVRAWNSLKSFEHVPPDEVGTAILSSEQGRLALSKALQQCRNRHAGSSMMELVVCGGVPPYSNLLSGKLTCLMMTSPEVAQYVQRRYGRSASIIASQLKGEPVVRPSTLVYLGTTSLYASGSSQYNRVVLPANTVIGQQQEVRFRLIGETEGFGALGLSNDTINAVREVAKDLNGRREVNNVFGEGANPNMRMLREGFDALGLSGAELLRHTRTRLIYGIDLATNVPRYLLGLDPSPAPIFQEPPEEASEQIAEYWRTRWLASRLDHAPALEALASTTPLQLRVSRLIPKLKRPQLPLPLFTATEESMSAPVVSSKPKQDDLRTDFIRRLYRDESSFSDHVNLKTLRELHIKTDLERVIKGLLEKGASVVLTGNAGDGKTHLLRMLQKTIKDTNAYEVSDASATNIGTVAAEWAEALNTKRPSCIAINEGPLFEMIKLHRNDYPFLAQVERDLHHNVYYEPVGEETKEKKWSHAEDCGGQVVIFDLSLRQNLAPKMVTEVLKKLTEDRWYEPCTVCKDDAECPVAYNRKALSTPTIQERICHLLEAVSIRGERYTYRELLAFVSYLIFGDRTCGAHSATTSPDDARYYNLAFEGGEGRLFDQLRKGLDPVNQTHPTVDAQLWCGDFAPEAFVMAPKPLPVSLDEPGASRTLGHQDDSLAAYRGLKRRWYFEHPEAKKLDPATEAVRLFRQFQDPAEVMQFRVGKLIGLLNRFRHRSATSESALRLWTSLTFSSRARSKAMVSGSEVPDLSLYLYRPRLAPHLEAGFGTQTTDHLLLGPADESKLRFANLRVDLGLLTSLLSRRGTPAGNQELFRNIQRFNDALANLAKQEGAVRTIWLVDGRHGREIKVRVDLQRRRYASLGT